MVACSNSVGPNDIDKKNKPPTPLLIWSQKDSFIGELYEMSLNGKTIIRLTNNKLEERDPRWSPNGKKIIFSAIGAINDNSDIYIMNSDGTNLTRVTNSGENLFPSWSPDGSKIVYSSYKNASDGFDICIIDTTGANKKQITHLNEPRRSYKYPVWSPDSALIAFVKTGAGYSNIYTIHPDGTDLRQLTHNNSNIYISYRSLTWLPKGNKISFVKTKNGDSNIFVTNIEDKNKKLLYTFGSDVSSIIAWSPNFEKIAYSKFVFGTKDNYAIFIMNKDGTGITQVSDNQHRYEMNDWK